MVVERHHQFILRSLELGNLVVVVALGDTGIAAQLLGKLVTQLLPQGTGGVVVSGIVILLDGCNLITLTGHGDGIGCLAGMPEHLQLRTRVG